MSTTLKIGGSFVTDPRGIAWQQLTQLLTDTTGQEKQNLRRRCQLEFPPLTSAQYAPWAAVMDAPGNYSIASGVSILNIYLPKRTNAAYTFNPECTFSTVNSGDNDSVITGHYDYHWVSGSFGPAQYIYDLVVELNMWIDIDITVLH